MTAYKDLVDLAKQKVVEGEIRVTHLVILIGQLRAWGRDTAHAESLLAEFDQSLVDMYEHLRVLQAKQDL